MITLTQLTMQYGVRPLFENVTLQFLPGYRYGIVGANGTGKSTFMKILAGEEAGHSGAIEWPGQIKFGVLKQDHFQYEQNTILDTVIMGRESMWQAMQQQKVLLEQDHLDEKESQLFVELEDQIHREGGYTAESDAAIILDGLGIPVNVHRDLLSTLSGGYKLRVLLAQLLYSQPDILLLDEPTNHLDLFSIRWLEDYLMTFPGLLLVISHDRDFINRVSTHIADIDYQIIRIYKGNYDAFLAAKALDIEQKERELAKQEKRRGELQGFVDRFKAKATKASAAQSRVKMLEKMEEIIIPKTSRISPHLDFKTTCKSGILPLHVKNINKAFGDKQVLQNVSFSVERGDKIALIGPNGIGKSTLLKILMGHLAADSGSFEWGHETYPAYFPQDHHEVLNGQMTLFDWLYEFDATAEIGLIRGLLAKALFTKDDVHKTISTLSGGEGSRLILAQLMLLKHNIMILDEPTNHLDMEAIDELSRALQAYPGTLIVVSHNRYFVSAAANRIIELKANGITDFKGSYDEYLEKRGTDHLDRNVDLKKRSALPEQKSASPKSEPEPAKGNDLGYHERKAAQRQERQLQKQIEQFEKQAKQAEYLIQTTQAKLEDYDSYSQLSLDKQQELIKERKRLDQKLENLMQEWAQAEEAQRQVQALLVVA